MSKEKYTMMRPEYSAKYLQIARDKGVVFESSEIPFLSVPPNLSDLAESSSLKNKLSQEYPQLVFNKACIVDGAVLIQDLEPDSDSSVSAMDEKAKDLNNLSKVTLQIVNGRSLSETLIKLLQESTASLDNPLVIFPGNGARVVSEYLQAQKSQFDFRNAIYLPTKRKMIKPGQFRLSVDYSSLPDNTRSKTAIIIDDVIASGQTVQEIVSGLRIRLPGIRSYVAASWIFVNPTEFENKESESGIYAISKTFSSLVLKGNYVARPPINSLSCLVRSDGTYDEMKTTYIEKYITDAKTFEQRLKEMKGER